MLAKVVKPATSQHHAGRPTAAGTLLKSKMTAAAGTIGTLWMSSAVGRPEQTIGKSVTVEKTATFSRDTIATAADN